MGGGIGFRSCGMGLLNEGFCGFGVWGKLCFIFRLGK